MPIRKPIIDATPKALKILEETIERTQGKGSVVIIGVGNTSGVGNSKKDVSKNEEEARKVINKIENGKKQKRRRLKLPFISKKQS